MLPRVWRGQEKGSVLVRLWYDDRRSVAQKKGRGVIQEYEQGHQLVVTEQVDAMGTLPDLALREWLRRRLETLSQSA